MFKIKFIKNSNINIDIYNYKNRCENGQTCKRITEKNVKMKSPYKRLTSAKYWDSCRLKIF